MKIVTWNVNSVRARLPRVVDWVRRNTPDLLCLQETKVVDEQFPRDAFEELGYAVEVHGQKTYNGVAFLSRGAVTDVARGFPDDADGAEARAIAGTYGGIRVVNLYVPNGQEVRSPKYEYKLSWLDRLLAHLRERHDPAGPVLICGDLNIAPDDRDVYDPDRWQGRVMFSDSEKERFRALVDWGAADALRLLTDEGGHYTWWDYRQAAFPRDWGLRIDHILVTPPVAARLRSVTADREERGGEKPSDHAPVVAILD